MLYVMTFADMRAVGPKVWNNWRDMLLGELYMRALDLFEQGQQLEEAGDAGSSASRTAGAARSPTRSARARSKVPWRHAGALLLTTPEQASRLTSSCCATFARRPRTV